MRKLTGPDGRTWTVHSIDADIGTGSGWHYLPDDYRFGWLVFECEGRKLRLAPVPPGWASMPDEALREALARAVPAPRASGEVAAIPRDPGPAPRK